MRHPSPFTSLLWVCFLFAAPPQPPAGMEPVERQPWGFGCAALLTGGEQGRALLCGPCIWQEDLGEASGLGTYPYLPRGCSPTGESAE